jgi:hypothetical protein
LPSQQTTATYHLQLKQSIDCVGEIFKVSSSRERDF